MNNNKEKTISYCLIISLFIIGIICYGAFPVETPDSPVRIMLKATAGKVLFDHKGHAHEDGYGIECSDCHHMWEDDGEKPLNCSECHIEDDEDVIKRSEAFHQQCIGCHEDDGTAPTDCTACHVM